MFEETKEAYRLMRAAGFKRANFRASMICYKTKKEKAEHGGADYGGVIIGTRKLSLNEVLKRVPAMIEAGLSVYEVRRGQETIDIFMDIHGRGHQITEI